MTDPYRPPRFDADPADPEQRAALGFICRTLDRLFGNNTNADAGPPQTGFFLVYFPLGDEPLDHRVGFICNGNNCRERMAEALKQIRLTLGGGGGPAGHA